MKKATKTISWVMAAYAAVLAGLWGAWFGGVLPDRGLAYASAAATMVVVAVIMRSIAPQKVVHVQRVAREAGDGRIRPTRLK